MYVCVLHELERGQVDVWSKMAGGGNWGGNERYPGWDCCAARTLCLRRGMYGGWGCNMFAFIIQYLNSSHVLVTLVYIFLAPSCTINRYTFRAMPDLMCCACVLLGGLGGVLQEFLAMVLPDLESSGGRSKDPAKEEQVRQAAAKAIKEIRSYGFEVRISLSK